MSDAQWGILELFGHKVIAGLISKDEMIGSALVRVDVPQTKEQPAFTQLFGTNAIYSISFVSEDVARLTAEQCAASPVAVYTPELVTKQHHDDEVDKLKTLIRLKGIPGPTEQPF